MTLIDCINDYCNFITHEQGVTKGTVETYKSWLRHFYRWLQTNGYPEPMVEHFNTATLRRFLYAVSARGYRPRTIRGIFHPIRRFGAFLVTNGVLTENPAMKVGLPKKDAAIRLTVSDDEVRLLLEAVEKQHKPRLVALTRAMLHILLFAGLRRFELTDLKVGDINLKDKSLLVTQG